MLLHSCDCWSQGAHDRIRQALHLAADNCRLLASRKPWRALDEDGAGGMTGLDARLCVSRSSRVIIGTAREAVTTGAASSSSSYVWMPGLGSVAAFAARSAREACHATRRARYPVACLPARYLGLARARKRRNCWRAMTHDWVMASDGTPARSGRVRFPAGVQLLVEWLRMMGGLCDYARCCLALDDLRVRRSQCPSPRARGCPTRQLYYGWRSPLAMNQHWKCLAIDSLSSLSPTRTCALRLWLSL
jgi:hypothetical protein